MEFFSQRRAQALGRERNVQGARALRYDPRWTVIRVAHFAHNQRVQGRDRLVWLSHQRAPEAEAMTRVRCARLLSLAVITALPLGALAPACSSGVATSGQRISCTDRGAGPVDCHPMTATTTGSGTGSGSDTCEDIDEDGDGTPHDEGEDDATERTLRSHDGTADSADDDDDDGDGIENERDCDNRQGDDADDDDEGDDDDDDAGSGSGGGSSNG